MPMIKNFTNPPSADGSSVTERQSAPHDNIVPCFTPGTVIATPSGERPVEALRPGDQVLTRDNGLQEIRWTGCCRLDGETLRNAPGLRPVRIRAGALDHSLPDSDILVSPWHKVLIQGDRTAQFFEDSEVLAAAGHLTGRAGIDVVDVDEVTYVHFMFDQHQVVLSNGFWTESFRPDDDVMRSLGARQRSRILELFPDLVEPRGRQAYRCARRTLSEQESRLLLE
ncbi:Hint domain-containing protein [Roseovarius salis]|uniref:Hint domain-containing protein n=1 Tax=Roseovarius salis TaxID=3376063 RepID=UPI0037C8A63B